MWRRWTCCLGAALLIAACSHGTLTRVVRTDGTIVVGELTAARPDAVVLKLADGSSITIPRSIIKTVESADPSVASNPSAAAKSGGQSAANGGSANGGPPTGGATTGRAGSAAGSASSPASGGVGNSGGSSASNAGANGGNTTSAANTRGGGSTSSGAASGGSTTGGSANSGPGGGATGGRALREAVAPSGTTLELALSAAIGSDSSNVDDKVDAVLRAPIVINGEPIVEAGAVAHGTVTEATPSEKAEGRGRLSVRFDAIQLGTRTVSIQTTPMHWEASGINKKPAADARGGKRGMFGKLVDKTKKGLHIGDDEAPRGSAEVRVAAGAVLRVRLEQPTRIAP